MHGQANIKVLLYVRTCMFGAEKIQGLWSLGRLNFFLTVSTNILDLTTSFFYALHLRMCISSPVPSRNVQKIVNFASISTIVALNMEIVSCRSSGAKN